MVRRFERALSFTVGVLCWSLYGVIWRDVVAVFREIGNERHDLRARPRVHSLSLRLAQFEALVLMPAPARAIAPTVHTGLPVDSGGCARRRHFLRRHR